METNLTKSERTIAVITLVIIAIFFALFTQLNRGSKSSPQFEVGSLINYTMARPEQAYSEYTLAGRELDHTFEGLPQGKRAEAKFDKKKKELIAKKAAETKKNEEIKKKQASPAKAQNLIQTQQKQQALAKQVTEKSTAKSEYRNEMRAGYINNSQGNNNVAAPQSTTDRVALKPKKSYPEWRNLLFAAPTTENLALFIAAFRKAEVTATEFQSMAQDLVDQSNPKLKALGLMALRSTPSLASLSQLVHLQTSELGDYQSYVEQSINVYVQPQNIQYLNQALSTKDKTLVSRSLDLLNASLIKFSQGDLAGLVDPRNRREGEVVTFSMNSYKSLLPALSQLAKAQDQELSALAQQVTALIQTANNVAQN